MNFIEKLIKKKREREHQQIMYEYESGLRDFRMGYDGPRKKKSSTEPQSEDLQGKSFEVFNRLVAKIEKEWR